MPVCFIEISENLKALPREAALFQVPYIGRYAGGLLRLIVGKSKIYYI